jgi:probable addiction module antidote protein
MPKETFTVFDAADYLDTPEAVSAYLDDVFSDGDPRLITHALGVVARAQGMSGIAAKTGISRQGLYKALTADARPEFSTVIGVLGAMGYRLRAEPKLAEAG